MLTGHTVNDQAETFLLNLIRGSGTDGLSAMAVVRPLDNENLEQFQISNLRFEISDLKSEIALIRPLLKWAKRDDTEAFCRDSGTAFRNDSMNDDPTFKRVRIRKELIPMLETMNPKIIETLAGTAELLGQGSANNSIQIDLSDELNISDLRSLEDGRLNRTLRMWLAHQRGNKRGLGLKHIEAIKRLVFSEKSGRQAELPGNASVLRKGGKLVYQKN